MEHTATKDPDRKTLQWAMTLSLVIGFVMFALKMGAYALTGSAAILSDAAESVVHVVAVCFAFYSLRLTYKPADAGHLYGHSKISFFSAGFEGAMIIIAAIYIIYTATAKWLHGLELERLGLGTTLTAAATLINGALGGYLVWTGKKKKSLILEANGKHVLTDCYTSLGVIVGLALVLLTGWLPWDPIFAILVAGNILFSGFGLVRTSVLGLMDVADPKVQEQLTEILTRESEKHHISYHGLRHRSLGNSIWVEVHLLFPENTSLRDAHGIATRIEDVIETRLEPPAQVTTHLETLEDHELTHANHPH
jgi:cation diffusion facilitator family transporter